MIVSGSQDTSIKIWDIKLKLSNCISTFKGHSDAVRSVIKISNDLIASCSSDESIKLWKISSMECVFTFKSEINQNFFMLCLLTNNRLVSGGTGNYLKVWDIKGSGDLKLINEEYGHQISINSILNLNNGKIATGGVDNSICLWNLEKYLK
jgi:WD40 repeat protein